MIQSNHNFKFNQMFRNLTFYDEHIHILLECKIVDFIVKFINERKQKNIINIHR